MFGEVKKILDLLCKKDENNKLEVSLFNNLIEKWAFILLGILAIVFIFTSPFEKTKYFSF